MASADEVQAALEKIQWFMGAIGPGREYTWEDERQAIAALAIITQALADLERQSAGRFEAMVRTNASDAALIADLRAQIARQNEEPTAHE